MFQKHVPWGQEAQKGNQGASLNAQKLQGCQQPALSLRIAFPKGWCTQDVWTFTASSLTTTVTRAAQTFFWYLSIGRLGWTIVNHNRLNHCNGWINWSASIISNIRFQASLKKTLLLTMKRVNENWNKHFPSGTVCLKFKCLWIFKS